MQLEGDHYRIVALTRAIASIQIEKSRPVCKSEIRNLYVPPFPDATEGIDEEFERIFNLCSDAFNSISEDNGENTLYFLNI